MSRILGGAALLVCLCISGCGGPGYDLVPVEGTVTLNGKPLANKSLLFTPESGAGISASANSDGSGKYKLIAIVTGVTEQQYGVPPGKYKVTVTEPIIPIKSEGMPEGFFMPDATEKSEIPNNYQARETTPLTVDVPETGGAINLELKS